MDVGKPSYVVFDENVIKYDQWFDRNRIVYENEISLFRKFFPCRRPCIEIGVGTGRFAQPLDVEIGLDPSVEALKIAHRRGVLVASGFGEMTPFRSESFSTVYIIVTLCFVENPHKVLEEAVRVLKKGGRLVVCIIPLDSSLGLTYHRKKITKESVFYSYATFYTKSQLVEMLTSLNLRILRVANTLTKTGLEPVAEEPVEGDKGSFVCYEAAKE
ncbi:MAG: class I SAM-dependent methyltransferase [Ignisphaera sp.]